ncbi:MAG: hypothetical protein ACI905_001434 [Roseivirga sp.]
MKNSASLSPKELKVLMDSDFLLTKQGIDIKISALLIDYQKETENFFKEFQHQLPPALNYRAGKVSKGQNYNGLPYWVVDLPSFFNQKDFFTYRMVVWWGNFISFSVVVSGEMFERMSVNLDNLDQTDLYYAINQSPWRIEFSEDNLIRIEQKERSKIEAHQKTANFIKVSKRYELSDLPNLKSIGSECFKLIISSMNWRNI